MVTPPDVRGTSADSPQPADVAVEIRFRLARSWRDELQATARAQGISMSDLLRLILRDFLRARYDPPAR